MVSYNPTTQKDIVKIPQYVSENSYSTPANFAIMPTASPTFLAPGRVQEIDFDTSIVYEESLALGNYDIADAIKTGELGGVKLKMQFSDVTFAKYGINAPNGVGTCADSLSFIFSKLIDNTEYYTKIIGARPQSTTLTLDRNLWSLDMTLVCRDISGEVTSHGLTTPVFASAPSTSMWGHAGVAANPFSWNSVAYDSRRFSITTQMQLALMEVNGDVEIVYSKVANRKTTMNIDVFKKSTVLRDDFKAGTLRSASMSVNSVGASSLTLTNCRIDKLVQQHIAGSKDLYAEKAQITVGGVTLA